jgi:hypothetical protein
MRNEVGEKMLLNLVVELTRFKENSKAGVI